MDTERKETVDSETQKTSGVEAEDKGGVKVLPLDKATVHRTPNPACPACIHGRMHSVKQWLEFHPFARHGFQLGQGWSHPELDPNNNLLPLRAAGASLEKQEKTA